MGQWISRADPGKEWRWLGLSAPLLLDRVQISHQTPDKLWVNSDIFMYKGKHITEGDEIDVHLWELSIGFKLWFLSCYAAGNNMLRISEKT